MVLQSRLPPFLLTRPLLQSLRFAHALRERVSPNLSIVISPLIAPHFLLPPIPAGPFDALVLTSETCVEALMHRGDSVPNLPKLAFCVGDQTARVARAAGMDAISAKGDADALIDLVKTVSTQGRLLHLHGTHTRGSVAERLNSAGFETVSLAIYQQEPQPLTAEAIAMLAVESQLCVPLFSPRSARLFGEQVMGLPCKATFLFVALSSAVSDAIDPRHVGLCVVAASPSAEAMLDAIIEIVGNRT